MNGDDDRCRISGLKRDSCAHCQPEKLLKKKCGAKTHRGTPCVQDAGARTPHLGFGFCWLHDYQGQNLIPHDSEKLIGNTVNCRSQYEKYAFQALDDDPNVDEYQYESIDIPYTFREYGRTYKADLLVKYSDGKKWVIEIKSMGDYILSEENYFKFKSADVFATENGMKFVIWVYNYGEKEVWSWERFRELAPDYPRLQEKAISDIQEKMQSINRNNRKTVLRKGSKA